MSRPTQTSPKPAWHGHLWSASTLLAGGGLVWVALVLIGLEINHDMTTEAGTSNLNELRWFWLAAGAGWLGLSGMLLCLWRGWRRFEGSKIGFGSAAIFIVFIAASARVMVLVGHEPVLSDDIWRYVYDGNNLASGLNPYTRLPQDLIDTLPLWAGERQIARLVNNPDLYTIYLPTSQFVFGGSALFHGFFAPSDTVPENHARVLRAVFVLIELGMIVLLLTTLRLSQRSAWWAALYAWHPLPLTEIAGSGHQDVIGMALLVATLFLATIVWQRRGTGEREANDSTNPARQHLLRWTGLLALAALVKPFVVPVAMFVLRGQSRKTWLISAGFGGVICATLLSPLVLLDDGAGLANLRETTSRFSLKWAHFGPVYEPLLWTIEQVTNDPDLVLTEPDQGHWNNDQQERLARGLCVGIGMVVFIWLFIRVRDPWVATRALLFTLLILSPATHPWYLLWPLVLLPMRPSAALWIASLTMLLAHAAWGYHLEDEELRWGAAPWVVAAAWVPVGLVLIAQVIHHRRSTVALSSN